VFVPADGAEAVSAAGFTDVRSPGAFDALSLEKTGESLVVTVVPATSPSGADYGFFLRHDAGGRTTTVYCTGDAVFSDEIRRIQRELGHANLLIQHLGDEQTADGALASPDAREAMQFVYRMQPNAVAAVHHTTWSHYRQPLEPFVEQIGRTIYERRLRVLSEGQSFEK
jgi:hypothetical protein